MPIKRPIKLRHPPTQRVRRTKKTTSKQRTTELSDLKQNRKQPRFPINGRLSAKISRKRYGKQAKTTEECGRDTTERRARQATTGAASFDRKRFAAKSRWRQHQSRLCGISLRYRLSAGASSKYRAGHLFFLSLFLERLRFFT